MPVRSRLIRHLEVFALHALVGTGVLAAMLALIALFADGGLPLTSWRMAALLPLASVAGGALTALPVALIPPPDSE